MIPCPKGHSPNLIFIEDCGYKVVELQLLPSVLFWSSEPQHKMLLSLRLLVAALAPAVVVGQPLVYPFTVTGILGRYAVTDGHGS